MLNQNLANMIEEYLYTLDSLERCKHKLPYLNLTNDEENDISNEAAFHFLNEHKLIQACDGPLALNWHGMILFLIEKHQEKKNILALIQALKDKRSWAIEQIDIILDRKEEYEKTYNERLGWIE